MSTSTSSLIPTAHLLVGPHKDTALHAHNYLMNLFCPAKGCKQCIICIKITEKRYEQCMWLFTDKGYTLDDIASINYTLSFALAKDETFFFIIENAHLLSLLCTNALLKSIEEPPAGYHFILLSPSKDVLTDTLRSRCVIFYIESVCQVTITYKKLYDHFTTSPLLPSLFLQELEYSKINEEQTQELFNQVLSFWQAAYNEHITHNTDKPVPLIIKKKLDILYRFALVMPTSGGVKLFWKGLLVQFEVHKNINL